MDGLIAALGTAALGAALVFEFVADQATGTTLAVATTLAYPLGDILMLSLVVGVVALTRWRPGGPGRCCCSGWPPWWSPTSPTRCNRPTSASRKASGSNRST